ncbi:argininosuccinate lyase [Desulfohalobiaceae bacterium Ax17]|uniref:argininosuccinate lyase n=1 Tax=Desulfovulcanus ferrireducens TaxID=2831190 RepID=UPI00207BB60E|nr:argininosuccinate lyase [Desulfovulcanus ferrireducens]MBT8764436.1 argininosuccinate lyase [Desulfovulcanus ferrireducens]
MDAKKDVKTKLWGGRFKESTAPLVEEYTQSVEFDQKLYAEDIAGSKAHARMLAAQGILSQEEVEQIIEGLNQIEKEIEQGKFTWQKSLEDVHMNIEHRLTELVGPVGQKLHTGRSRNDQVALDFRLHVSKCLSLWQDTLIDLVTVLVDQAEKNADKILPGYTHLQPAQPVSLAQHLLAYVQMFCRDFERILDAQKRVRVSPLGAAALAGTTYPLNPKMVADELGLDEIFSNSMDAVSDRDFVLEALFIGSTIMIHLSRLCEEIILWANPGFGFIYLPDAFATGSSIMPQKKNPDVAEIMRGKTGRSVGNLISLLTTLKGLPLAYNRDMQEDKEPFLDTHKTVYMSLQIMARMMEEIKFNEQAMNRALKEGFLNATELADYLVGKGIPFRQAHHITGNIVAYAERKGVGLEDLAIKELKQFSEKIEEDVYIALDFKQAVSRRETPGGTGPQSVQRQIQWARQWLRQKNGGSV